MRKPFLGSAVLSIAALINLIAVQPALAVDDIDSSPFIVEENLRVAPNEYSGAFTYDYPIRLPPGRSGLQPQLSLTYSSADTNPGNIVGYGWDLSIPKIERMSKYGSDDLYDRHDFYSSLSGELEDISLVDATHGDFGAKVDDGSFLTYEYTTSETWTVTDKQGTVYIFGDVASARMEDPSDSTRVHTWYLSEVSDTDGNTITYTYSKDGNRVYPTGINYTGHDTASGLFDIEFTREARDDVYVSYATGFAVTTDERIAAIDVQVDGVSVWSYELDYAVGDNDTRSLLVSVTETNKPAVTFGYSTASRTYTEDASFAFPLAIGNTGSGSLAVYLFDVDGDAYPDIVRSTDTINEVYINNGDNTWTIDANYTVPVSFASSTGKDRGVRILDVNGDGLQDILSSRLDTFGTHLQAVYINDGDGTGWTQDINILIPTVFVSSTGLDYGVRIVDVDGDGMQDLIRGSSSSGISTREAYLNNGDGTGWTSSVTYIPPVDFVLSNKDTGIRALDVNGDQLIDLVQAANNNSAPMTENVYINNGTSWILDANYDVPLAFVSPSHVDLGMRDMDVNGDGLVDLVYSHTDAVYGLTDRLFINNGDGTGWSEDVNFVIGVPFTGSTGADQGARGVDIDGDILPEILYSRSNGIGGWDDYLYVLDDGRADLLTEINFPAGAGATVTYTSSAALNSGLWFPLQVVDSIATHDGLGNVSTVSYTYEQGSYYYASEYDRRLAGFGKVTAVDGLGQETINYFHQGNDTDSTHGESTDDASKIGRRYRQEIYDDASNLFKTSITDWDSEDLGNDRDFVFANSELVMTYDGDGDHTDTLVDYTYDNANGNLLEQEALGFVNGNDDGTYADTGTDEIVTTYTYATDANGIIRNAVSSVEVEGSIGGTASLTNTYYDGLAFGSVSVGNATKQSSWIASTTYADTLYTYDTYGLVTSVEDAEGSITTYDYDLTDPMQPILVTNDLGHETEYDYDLASGQVSHVVDPNGGEKVTTYDGFGRPTLIEQSQPAGGVTLDEVVEYVYDDTNFPNSVHEIRHLNGSTTVDTYTYLDGLGRVIQVRKEAEVSTHYSVNDTSYDAAGHVAAISLSYDSTGTARTSMTTDVDLLETYEYDALDRVIEVINAAGATTSAYDQSIVTTTDANGEVKSYDYNAFGLLEAVEENNNSTAYNTTYQYSVLGNLTKYTDASGNVRNFTYDQLGRRLTAEDLHATTDTEFGSWTYTYDKLGNLLTTTDANGKVITNTYDELHRLETEDDNATVGTDVTYTYDTGCTNGIGYLCSVTGVNGVTTDYDYDYLGRANSTALTVDGTTYTTGTTHDRQGNETTITNPNGTKNEYTFGTAGRVTSVGWRTVGGVLNTLVSSVTYAPHGAAATISYANGVTSTYDYDEDELYRLYNKLSVVNATEIEDVTYTYDAVGNITQIADAPGIYASITTTMAYDDLHRLTQSVASSTDANFAATRNYTYDALGSMLTGPSGTYLYQSTNAGVFSNPHAATSIGGVALTYDKNGNLLTDTIWTHGWDFKNRLTQSAKTGLTVNYTYDHTGNRIKKTDNVSNTPTYYISPSYEIEGGLTRYHVAAPGIGNIATINSSLAGTIVAYHHTDHLGSSHVETNNAGAVLQYLIYEPFGKVRYNYRSGAYNDPYKFTGKELDTETNLHYFEARYYAAPVGKFISADPAFLSLGHEDSNELRDPQMWNAYAYARNNPYNYLDPDGNWAILAAIRSIAVATIARVAPTVTIAGVTLSTNSLAQVGLADSMNTAASPQASPVEKAIATIGAATSFTIPSANGASSIVRSVVVTQSDDAARVGYTVYQSVKNGVVEYVGITNNMTRRASEHLRNHGRFIQEIRGLSNLSRDEARGVEQLLIDRYGLKSKGGTLSNAINSVSSRNSRYTEILQMGQEILENIGQ